MRHISSVDHQPESEAALADQPGWKMKAASIKMEAAFISEIQPRFSLRNRSDRLPDCSPAHMWCADTCADSLAHYARAPRNANADRSRARSGPRIQSPGPDSHAGRVSARSQIDAHK